MSEAAVGALNRLQRIHVFEGVTAEGNVLVFERAEPLVDIDLVRVVTTKLAGRRWPARHEIELIGAESVPGAGRAAPLRALRRA